jgi:nucleotide-binding universal stress UspA family protein
MIQDIVVNLNVGGGDNASAAYAVSAASMLHAHITGVAFAYEPSLPGASMGYLPVEILEAKRRDNEAAARTAIDQFIAATELAGVSAEPWLLSSTFADAVDRFGQMARRFDIAIVAQGEPDNDATAAAILENTLFASGRPVIVVPYIQRAPLKLNHAMICWDGSRPAARAIADAMPLLEQAHRTEVVIVAKDARHQEEIEGADIGLHLARHGLNVEVTRIERDGVDVANALLSHSVDCGADFIVMGAYGHSRLREFVLGGVTRSMLRSMMVPTLMSH